MALSQAAMSALASHTIQKKKRLSEIIDALNDLFGAEISDDDQLHFANGVADRISRDEEVMAIGISSPQPSDALDRSKRLTRRASPRRCFRQVPQCIHRLAAVAQLEIQAYDIAAGAAHGSNRLPLPDLRAFFYQ